MRIRLSGVENEWVIWWATSPKAPVLSAARSEIEPYHSGLLDPVAWGVGKKQILDI